MKTQRQYFVVLTLLVAVTFVIGLILGNAYRSASANEVEKFLQESELNAESFRVEQDLFEQFDSNCAPAQKRLSSLSSELWQLGKLFSTKDSKERLGGDYVFLKKKYHLMQMRTYVLEKRIASSCKNASNVILYYFTQNDPLSEDQGKILDLLVEDYDVHVFAIEYNYAKELTFLETYYGISRTPALVVNFNNVIQGLGTKEQIIPLLYE